MRKNLNRQQHFEQLVLFWVSVITGGSINIVVLGFASSIEVNSFSGGFSILLS